MRVMVVCILIIFSCTAVYAQVVVSVDGGRVSLNYVREQGVKVGTGYELKKGLKVRFKEKLSPTERQTQPKEPTPARKKPIEFQVEKGRDLIFYIRRGNECLEQRDFDKARKYFQRVLLEVPDDIAAKRGLAQVEEAVQAARREEELRRRRAELLKNAEYHEQMAGEYARKGDYELAQQKKAKEAKQSYEESMRLDSSRQTSLIAKIGRLGPSERVTNNLGMEFVYIKPGAFQMGSPSSEAKRDSDEVRHRVTLTKGYYMQKTEVTVGQFSVFVKETSYSTEAERGDGAYVYTGGPWRKKRDANWRNPCFTQGDEDPVVCVSWNDAQVFIRWLNGKESEKYRLPTEAEWEYSCRAGTTTAFHYGNSLSSSQANFDGYYPYGGASKGVYRKKTVSVGSFAPNAWGLYDMHGNVWEWCKDWYGKDYYKNSPTTDPRGPSSGAYRVNRGGSWNNLAERCRSAIRYRITPDSPSYRLGFRLVREVE